MSIAAIVSIAVGVAVAIVMSTWAVVQLRKKT